jgi:Meiotic cell cortex C-terminal pleckstrin homology
VIQSVLDVRDDTPLPKNHGIAEPFNRSILILTPARALKFTAMSRERHYTWLTALSFLAHSPLLAPGLASLPAPPSEPQETPGSRSRAATLKRSGIRDSVRIAKDRARPIKTPKSDHSAGTIPEIEFQAAFGSHPVPSLPDIPMEPAAEPPTVPRFAHGRKRSLTGPSRMPTSAISRSLVYKEIPSPAFPMPTLPSPSIADFESGRTSQASSATRATFLDTVGTIRMEAFIDQQHNMRDFSPELGSRRRGNMLHSPIHPEMKRGGIIMGDDFDVSGGGFDPFKDFNTH